MKQVRKTYSLLFAVFFSAWLLSPFILDNLIGTPKNNVSKRENRALAKRPALDAANLDPYPAAFGKFFNDNFPYREPLINWWSEHVDMGIFKKPPPNSEVDIGFNGWLFYTSERPVYEGTEMLTPEQIELVHQTIRERVIFYRSLGIKFYVFIPPMKSEVYPEFLPSDYMRVSDSTQTQKLITVLLKDTLIPFIDVRPSIMEARNKSILYALTDNHWNTKGAFEAYCRVINRIRKDFPSIRPVIRKDVTFNPFRTQGGNLAIKLGIEKQANEIQYLPVFSPIRARDGKNAGYKAPPWFGASDDFEHVKVVADSSLPRVVVIRDSFFIQMMPYFQENFRKTVYIFDAWQYELNRDIIEKEKPDIVVLEVYEPNIKNIIHLY